MYFCPNCDNVFNITKELPSQSGGVKSDSPESEMSDMTNDEKIVNKLLADEHFSEKDLSSAQLVNLLQSVAFKRLKHKQKEFVYNKIQDLLPVDQKKILEETPKQVFEKVYFICNNCGDNKPIDKGTLIFSKVSTDIAQSYSPLDVDDMKYSDILPRTRKYICPNTKCESHTNPQKREAIFFRMNNTFRIKHICKACDTSF
jgi:hypothetical protein